MWEGHFYYIVISITNHYLSTSHAKFYEECLNEWSLIHNTNLWDYEQVMNETIYWNNKYVRIVGKYVYRKSPAGIRKILSSFTPNSTNNDQVKSKPLSYTEFYCTLIDKVKVPPTFQSKFNSLYPNDNLDWNKSYQMPFRATLESKTGEIQ